MGNITTTNRMAILDLIAQADETVEVSGLSASVSELQIEVMSLSASVAAITGGATGPTGPAGTNGTSGTSGVSGTSGTSGANGTSGTSGAVGVSGTSGTSGINGTSGTSGANGTSGTSGANGTSGTSGGGDLQTVTDSGNTTTNDIQLIDDAEVIFGATGGILFNNSSRLREGTIDAGLGGSKGIAQICAVGYEMKWEAGSLYIMNGDGTEIREVRYTFGATPSVSADDTKGFTIDSRWVLDNGDVYVCSDNSTGAAVWSLIGIQSSTASNVITTTDGTNTSTLELYSTEQLTTIDDGAYTNTLSLVADNTTQNITDGTNTLTEIKQSNQNKITIDDGGAVRNTSITQGFDSIVLQQGNRDYDEDITSYISLETKDSGVSTGIGMGTTNGSITTSFNQGSSATDMNWADGTINTVITLNVNGAEIASVVGGDSVTQTIEPTLFRAEATEYEISTSTLNITPTGVSISSTDGTMSSFIELDPTNNNNGNRFYSTDGSSTNDLTLSPDYVMWDCNYVTGDTRVGLEFDPSGLLGVTRFYKENYVTNEGSSLGLDTTNISLSSSDASDTTSVGLDLTSILLSVDTPSNNRLQEISLDTDIVISSSSGGTTSNITIMEDIVTIISTDGVEQGELRVEPKGITFKFIPAFDDDADAASGGLTADMLYQTTGLGASPLDVAGILMIKQ
jgi:hypothetical protein